MVNRARNTVLGQVDSGDTINLQAKVIKAAAMQDTGVDSEEAIATDTAVEAGQVIMGTEPKYRKNGAVLVDCCTEIAVGVMVR